MQKRLLNTALLTLLAAMAMPAQAVDLTWSGFGTFGYARSDQSFNYQRFIDNGGTVKRDTVVGAQVDARFSQEWSATVQAKAAPSDHSDSQWQASVAWAFLSWRPNDDWLIRAGKIRLPLMLNTENSDVGATYDMARLPLEVYSIAPTTDVVGVSISKTWLGDSFDLVAEAYTGETSTYWRYYGRDRTIDNANSPGSWFLPIDMKSSGLVLTARSLENTFRVGYHEGEASRPGEKTGAGFEYLNPPGLYRLLPGGVDKLRVPIITLGASVMLPADFRLTSEYAKAKIESASRGLSRWGAYVALMKRMGAWTPYVYYAKTKSTDGALGLYQQINANAGAVPAPLRSSQTLMADLTSPYDQSTVALGTSFWVTSKSVIKAELSQVRTGIASSFVDAPAGSDSGNRHINIFSLSYSFSF
uniref:Membrane protein involved in aromatic hydrocarbon degradation n=1 Tax=Dechloromonas aromatica (strain RCB) TaxID=159087 RepID=Q47AE5_DECAR